MKDTIEILADAVVYGTQYLVPESDAYRASNPGSLSSRPFSGSGEPEPSLNGKRVYASFSAGYESLKSDLRVRLSGKSRQPATNLRELLDKYFADDSQHRRALRFLRRAFNDGNIYERTPVSYFAESRSEVFTCQA